MKAEKQYLNAVVILWLVLGAAIAHSKPIEEREWIRMESANFTIHSLLTKSNTRDLLRHLEAVRSMFPVVTDGNPRSRVPTVIYAVRSENDFRELGFDPDGIVGLFQPQIRQNTIIIREMAFMSETAVIVHEYVHYLLYNMLHFPFPKWYQEGYAEYLSSSTLGARHFVIGQMNTGVLNAFQSGRWLPMEDVISSQKFYALDNDVIQLKLYAQSFLLTHYLWARPDREQSVTESLKRYGSAIQDGASELEAFEIGFGIAVDDLELELKKYLNRGKFFHTRYDTKTLIPDFSTITSKLSEADISIELAELFLRQQLGRREPDLARVARARQLYERALEDETTRARAEIGIAYILELEGDLEGAADRLTYGASLAADNLNAQLDAARFWLDRIDGEDSDRDHLTAKAYPYLLSAVRINEYSPEVSYMSGLFYLKLGEIEQGAELLERAAHRAPGVRTLRWSLAKLLAKMDRPNDALRYAKDVLSLSHDSSGLQAAALALIERLEDSEGPLNSESN